MRCAAATLPFVCAVLLTGCAPPSEPSLTSPERDVIRAELSDDNWRPIAVEFPQALRPEVLSKQTLNDRDWSARMVRCLGEAGYIVTEKDGNFSFGQYSERPPIGYAIATFVCRSRYPTLSQVVQYLDRRQLEGLYSYYLATVRPCLLLAGAPSPKPPSRMAFVLSAFGRLDWHPFSQVWNSGMPDPHVRYLEQRCPPIPTWLDLHE